MCRKVRYLEDQGQYTLSPKHNSTAMRQLDALKNAFIAQVGGGYKRSLKVGSDYPGRAMGW